MIKKLNVIWKHFIFVCVAWTLMLGLIVYNFYYFTDEMNLAKQATIGLFVVLALHALVMLALVVVNIVQQKFFRAGIFLITSAGLFVGLYFVFAFMLVSVIGGPPVDEGNRHNFQPTTVCDEFHEDEIKRVVEGFGEGRFPSTLNNLEDFESMPKAIAKIECGCRISDPRIVVFRLWDADNNTFELEMSKELGEWQYTSFAFQEFE